MQQALSEPGGHMDVSRAVERVPMSMPLCGFYEGYSWTYSECLYRQEGVLYPKTMYPTPVSSIPLKRSPLIFIIGGPGSGKSTVAANLAADLGLVHIEPDVIVGRLSLTGPPQAWDAVKNTMNEHGQVPEWMLNVLVKMEILKHQESSSCIFLMDNFPKTAAQFRVFSDMCSCMLTICLDVTSATMMRRFIPRVPSFPWTIARMETYLYREAAFARSYAELSAEPDFAKKLVRVCAELEFDEYYPYLRNLVRRTLLDPKAGLAVKELGIEAIPPQEYKFA